MVWMENDLLFFFFLNQPHLKLFLSHYSCELWWESDIKIGFNISLPENVWMEMRTTLHWSSQLIGFGPTHEKPPCITISAQILGDINYKKKKKL